MSRSARLPLCVATILASATVAFSQPAKFEDVVRSLRNPDPKIRVSAVRLLREAGYTQAIVPMAPLVNDPVNEIQLEAIRSELAFFLVEPVAAKKRLSLMLEGRTGEQGPAAFEAGPLATWPKAAPAELIDALLTAIDDDNKKVRLEAVYTLGVVAGASGTPLPAAGATRLTKALDHHDPAVRAGAARVIGRLRITSASEGLLKSVNDSSAAVRFASIRALGEIGDEKTVQALTDQLNYYEDGDGASAALTALSRIAHPSSAPVFLSYLTHKDPALRRAAVEGLARTGDAKTIEGFVQTVNQDEAENVRAAMAFALHRKGYANYLGRMIDFMDHEQSAEQIQQYLLELGPSVVPHLVPRLQEPDEGVREHLAEVLGSLGNQTTVTVLTPLKNDPNREVATAATHAIERIKMAQK